MNIQKSFLVLLLVICAPAISAQGLVRITPDCAIAGQTLDVTITGMGTKFTDGLFNQGSMTSGQLSLSIPTFYQGSSTDEEVNALNVINDTLIIANITVPDSAISGLWDVYLSYATSGSGAYNYVLEGAFYVSNPNEPKIIDVTPNTALPGQTLDVTITGLGTRFTEGSFTQGSWTNDVYVDMYIPTYFQGSPWMPIVNTVTVIDNTTLMANITVPDSVITGLGVVQVSYYTQSSESYNFAMVDAFSVTNANEPKIIDVTPGTAVSGQTLDVTITGMGTRFTEGVFTQGSVTSDVWIYFDILSFNQGSSTPLIVNTMNVVNNTQLIANITVPDSVVSGFASAFIYYNLPNMDYYQFFMVDALYVGGMISSVSPGVLYQGQSATLSFDFDNTAIASNFRFWLSNNSLGCLEEIFPTSTSITGNTISANLDIPVNALTGWWDIKVTNHGDGMITGRGLVQIVDINTMGAIESGNHSQLHIYPNPMTYNTTLSFNNDDGSAYSLVAYDVLGKQVLAQEHITENKVVLEKGSLDRGVYIIVLQGLENTYRGRLVVD